MTLSTEAGHSEGGSGSLEARLLERRAQLRRALDDAGLIVDTITARDLVRPTPCAGWTLSDLLGHLIGQHLGFAEAVLHGEAALDAYCPRPLQEHETVQDVTARWRDSVAALTAALAQAAPDRPVTLVEVSRDQAIPLEAVLTIQLVDTAVHTWDVARTLGRDHTPPADVVATVLAVAWQIPDDHRRRLPGAAFAPACGAAPDEAGPASAQDDWVTTLALLGRRAEGPV